MTIIDVQEGETYEAAEKRQRSAEKAAKEHNRPSIVDMARDQYDRLARVNFSTLKHIGRSPAHYHHELLNRDPLEGDTTARKLGRVRHLAVFEPELFAEAVAVWRGGRRAGKDWDAFCEQHAGCEIITQDEHGEVLALARAVRSDATAAKYLQGGRREVTLLWTHTAPKVGGLAGYSFDCKARLDFLAPGFITDLKTTRDASPSGFGRHAWNYKLHVQAAFYVDAVAAVTGKALPYFVVAVEAAAPHVVQVYRMPDALLEAGRDEYRTYLDRLAFCRAESRWPAYADGELDLELPHWAQPTEHEEEDASELGIHIPKEDA